MPWSKIKYFKSLRTLLMKADTHSRVSSCIREVTHRPTEFESPYKRVKHGWNTCIENAPIWKKKMYICCPYACLTPAYFPHIIALCENYLIAPAFRNYTVWGEHWGLKQYNLQTRKSNKSKWKWTQPSQPLKAKWLLFMYSELSSRTREKVIA